MAMEYSVFLASLMAEFEVQGLEVDDSGPCALDMDGHLVYVSRLQQCDAECVVLTAPVGSLNTQDGAEMSALLAFHLAPEGIQFNALEGHLLVMTRLFPLQDLNERYFFDALNRFVACLAYWCDRLQNNSATAESSPSPGVVNGAVNEYA